MRVALAHDYVTQRGGAERVVLSLLKAFPGAPLYTSLYDPPATFPEFQDADVRTLVLDRLPLLRRNHRLALPLLAPAFDRLELDVDVLLCSSSGWAHGARTRGRKVVYCHTPARWLYQPDRYLATRRPFARAALGILRPSLVRWDRRAAASADRYLTNSTAVRERIRRAYGIDAEVVPPPPSLDPTGTRREVPGLDPGFLLCVSRLLPYKNVDAVLKAFAGLPSEQLVVVGTGPEERRLQTSAPRNVSFLGAVSDDTMRWLYASCLGLVAASHEDYGLTPLEAASFGKPSAVLRWGGFLDTVVEGETGVFFGEASPGEIREAVTKLGRTNWRAARLRDHVALFSEARFTARLRELLLAG